MNKKVGFIGVGHFAGYLVEGFRKASPEMTLILSPRGKTQSNHLAKKYNCEIVRSNQDVIDRSDIIILSIRPKNIDGVLKDLEFTDQSLIISVVAGASLDLIRRLVTPATAVCALPISCAAINQSPTFLYPDHEIAKEVLSYIGTVISFDNQDQFNTAGTYSAFYGWSFKFLEEMAGWGSSNGLPEDVARNIVQQIFIGMAGMAAKEIDNPLKNIVNAVATKGGITELGLNILDEQNGYKPWHDAMDAVHNRLSNK